MQCSNVHVQHVQRKQVYIKYIENTNSQHHDKFKPKSLYSSQLFCVLYQQHREAVEIVQ